MELGYKLIIYNLLFTTKIPFDPTQPQQSWACSRGYIAADRSPQSHADIDSPIWVEDLSPLMTSANNSYIRLIKWLFFSVCKIMDRCLIVYQLLFYYQSLSVFLKIIGSSITLLNNLIGRFR